MKLALFVSQSLLSPALDLRPYIPADADEIIFNGDDMLFRCIDVYLEAVGREAALTQVCLRPEVYGGSAWIAENRIIIRSADRVLALWDGESAHTKNAIDNARALGAEVQVYIIDSRGASQQN